MTSLLTPLYGNYRNRKFSEIWKNVEEFSEEYQNNGIKPIVSADGIQTLFYLLYARYGNSTVASSDENQFKYKVWTTIFMYGPTWEKRLELQEQIRQLPLDKFVDGSKAIYNRSLNPSTPPSTGSLEELETIDEQNTTNYKRSVSEAYAALLGLLETDVTAYFLDRFKKLFLTVVAPEFPLWYETPLNENTEEDD